MSTPATDGHPLRRQNGYTSRHVQRTYITTLPTRARPSGADLAKVNRVRRECRVLLRQPREGEGWTNVFSRVTGAVISVYGVMGPWHAVDVARRSLQEADGAVP